VKARGTIPIVALSGGLLALGLPAAAQAQSCPSGAITGSVGPLTVASGQSVDLCGGRVGGAVAVRSGGSFSTELGPAGQVPTIGGGVSAQAGSHIELRNAQVGGPVTSTGAATSGPFAVLMCSDTVAGDVNVSGAQGLVEIGDDDDLCAAPGNTIHGAVNASGDLNGLDLADNSIHGGVTVDDDALSYDYLNSFECSYETTCTGAAEVGDNVIHGALTCLEDPNGVFTDEGPNTVAGRTTGACVNEGMFK
jgi:hypothetical protein